ncbi:MAG: hypothetical protein WBG50_22975 [Desulfomonilaceae bacterium]
MALRSAAPVVPPTLVPTCHEFEKKTVYTGSPGSQNSLPLRITLSVVALACFLVFVSAGTLRGRDYDVGVITDMSEGNIYVKSNLGTYELETFEPCLWCEVGLQVVVHFEGFTRATIAPYSKSVLGGPVRVFVIKDGRDED